MTKQTEKTFAAIDAAGYVVFAFTAPNSEKATYIARNSFKKRSERIEKVRLLKADDMGLFGAEIEFRG